MSDLDMAGFEFAIRCDCLDIEYTTFKDSYYKAFKENGLEVTEWLCSLEKGNKKGKLHWHAYALTEGEINVKYKTWTDKFNLSLTQLLPTIKGNAKNLQLMKNFDSYLSYITKDGEIYDDWTISQEQYDKIIAETERINADKAKSSSLKVYELLDLKKIHYISDFTEQVLNIYENEWGKEPPQPHVIKKHLIYYLKRKGDYDNISYLYGIDKIIF